VGRRQVPDGGGVDAASVVDDRRLLTTAPHIVVDHRCRSAGSDGVEVGRKLVIGLIG